MRQPDPEELHRQLVPWYDRRKRDLPFRKSRDPYAILVAEILLQRTRVKAGLPYYERFLAAFPTVRELAAASESEVLRAWEGLGFYRRARNLHQAAREILDRFGGAVPSNIEALRSLPGIGDYTAGAVGSIAFDLPVPAIDGNVTRVLSRVFEIAEDVSRGRGRKRLVEIARSLVPPAVPGTWNQALMELGAIICLPRAPRCRECPLSSHCLAFASGTQDSLPKHAAKRKIPIVPVVFAIVRDEGSVLLVRRRDGLHAGMYGLPGGERGPEESEDVAIRRLLSVHGVTASSLYGIGHVRHTFSHRRWDGHAFAGKGHGTPRGAEWIPLVSLEELPMVPLHRRLLQRAMSSQAF